MKTPKLKRVAPHVICWMIFILYEVTTVFILNGNFAYLGTALAYYPIYIALFYTNAIVVLPLCFGRNSKVLLFLLVSVAEIGFAVLLKYQLDRLFLHFSMPWDNHAALIKYIFVSSWRAFYFWVLSGAFWLVRRLFMYRQAVDAAEKRHLVESAEKATLERDIAEIRFASLQQQINPHFLFNTLNFVYSSVLKLSPVAADALARLSEVMRYGLRSQSLSARMSLEAEMEQIENLIELNRVRLDHPEYINYEFTGNSGALSILPLVLLTFAENLFKHGDLSDPARPAEIRAAVDSQGVLRFQTWNVKKSPGRHDDAPRTGMANTIRRLDHAYAGKYQLEVDSSGQTYKLTLILAL